MVTQHKAEQRGSHSGIASIVFDPNHVFLSFFGFTSALEQVFASALRRKWEDEGERERWELPSSAFHHFVKAGSALRAPSTKLSDLADSCKSGRLL